MECFLKFHCIDFYPFSREKKSALAGFEVVKLEGSSHQSPMVFIKSIIFRTSTGMFSQYSLCFEHLEGFRNPQPASYHRQ